MNIDALAEKFALQLVDKEMAGPNGVGASSSVSDGTDYLVAGEEPGSKLKDAKKADMKIIDESK